MKHMRNMTGFFDSVVNLFMVKEILEIDTEKGDEFYKEKDLYDEYLKNAIPKVQRIFLSLVKCKNKYIIHSKEN